MFDCVLVWQLKNLGCKWKTFHLWLRCLVDSPMFKELLAIFVYTSLILGKLLHFSIIFMILFNSSAQCFSLCNFNFSLFVNSCYFSDQVTNHCTSVQKLELWLVVGPLMFNTVLFMLIFEEDLRITYWPANLNSLFFSRVELYSWRLL